MIVQCLYISYFEFKLRDKNTLSFAHQNFVSRTSKKHPLSLSVEVSTPLKKPRVEGEQ